MFRLCLALAELVYLRMVPILLACLLVIMLADKLGLLEPLHRWFDERQGIGKRPARRKTPRVARPLPCFREALPLGLPEGESYALTYLARAPP